MKYTLFETDYLQMRFVNVLEQFGIASIDFATLEAVLREYKYPRDKVSQM